MESNGSTSMASVCAGVLDLMDAGVPIKRPVAGISVGLVTENDDQGKLTRHTLLTDIIGSEDHFGDMDFKLCGTEQGVTGFQLDLKLKGISHELMAAAIDDARKNRGLILSHMTQTLPAPRGEMSKYAPRIETVVIPKDKIGLIIGPGGKTIKGIVAETGAEINVEEEGAHGLVHIYSNNAESLQRAKEIVQGMTKEITIDEMYEGTVVSIKEFGAFVEVMPGKDGLVHISELADTRVNKVEDVVKVGDRIWVKCIGVDDKGKVKLSRRAAMKDRDIIASGGTVAPTPDVKVNVGETYEGTVVSLKDFGAFVEILPGKDGLVHISELADVRVNRVEDVVRVGDVIWVKCIGIDDKGKVKLSRKAAMKERDKAASGGAASEGVA
jgi:polyribonucleotide nucleotidyltransferase